MHIAICMDIAADRKQLERLLGRSTDARLAKDSSVPFYIQSYGNKEALLNRPFLYNLFFIDLLNDTMDSVQLIHELRKMGVSAPIVLCPSQVDLSDKLNEEDNVIVLRQPILVKDLENVMDIAVEQVKNQVPTLSIRNNQDTIFVTEEEFLYAKKERDMISIYLSNDREIKSPESLKSFYGRARGFSKVVPISDSMIVNTDYIDEIGIMSVTLKNQKKYIAMGKYISAIKKITRL